MHQRHSICWYSHLLEHVIGLAEFARKVWAHYQAPSKTTTTFALIAALILVPLPGSAKVMVGEVYGGYYGCDRWMHTDFFEILPGETVSVYVNLTGCAEGYFKYGFIFYGYKDKLANYLAKKHGIEFEILDSYGYVMEPDDSHNGCYLTGKSAGVWLDLKEPTMLVLTATNTKSKSQMIRLQSSTNIMRPRGC